MTRKGEAMTRKEERNYDKKGKRETMTRKREAMTMKGERNHDNDYQKTRSSG
jgi:hypothetical protein